jgi:hypothetical protein
MSVDEREPTRGKGHCQRQSGETGPRPEVNPLLAGHRWSESRETERVVDMALTQASSFPRTQEPSLHGFEILALQPSQHGFGSIVKHRTELSRPSLGLRHPDWFHTEPFGADPIDR